MSKRRIGGTVALIAVLVLATAVPASARWSKRNSPDFTWYPFDGVATCANGVVVGLARSSTNPGPTATSTASFRATVYGAVDGSPPEGTEVAVGTIPLVFDPITLDFGGGNVETKYLSGIAYFPFTQPLPEGTFLEMHVGVSEVDYGPVSRCEPPVVVPGVGVTDASVNEGDNGTRTLDFVVSMQHPLDRPITVGYQTAPDSTPGLNPATSGSDYVHKSSTLTFAPGQVTKQISVTVKPDVVQEGKESLCIALALPPGVFLLPSADFTGCNRGTIRDDDNTALKPALVVGDATVHSGFGRRLVVVDVALSRSLGAAKTFNFRTAAATATSGIDYVAQNGSFTMPAGSRNYVLKTWVNTEMMVGERFTFRVTDPTATYRITDGTGLVTRTA